MITFSFTNLLEHANLSVAPTTEDTIFIARNALEPHRPFRPYRSLTIAAHTPIVADLGGARPLGIVAIINANVNTMTIQGAATPGGAAGYTNTVTLSRAATGRYHTALRPSTYNHRYFRVVIPGQTPVVTDTTNYVTNASFEQWPAGGVTPTDWSLYGTGVGTWRITATDHYLGQHSVTEGRSAVGVARNGQDCGIYQDMHVNYGPLAWWNNRVITMTADVRCDSGNRALIALSDGIGTSFSSYHTGDNTIQTLMATHTVAPTATFVRAWCVMYNSDGAATYDNVIVRQVAFSLGGVWAGDLMAPPRDILMEPDEDVTVPVHDEAPSHGGWRQRAIMGRPCFRFTARRLASGEAELAAWREIDRQWDAVDYALVCLRENYPAETYVMRRVSTSRWRHGRLWSESEMELEEVVR